MNKRDILIVICLIICVVFSLQTAVAGDSANDTGNVLISQDSNVSAYSLPNSNQVLQAGSDDAGSFSDLQNDLSTSDTTINLNKNYTWNSDDDSAITTGISITKDLTINGNGKVIIDAQGKTRIFNIASGVNVVLNGITFVNGNASTLNGGAIFSQGSLTIDDCNFINNTAVNGGAVYMNEGIIKNTTFKNNTADDDGGAVYVYANKVNLLNSTFIQNHAVNGGAIYWYGINGTAYKLNVYYNTATRGGGIFLSKPDDVEITGGNSLINSSDFAHNTATSNGGSVYAMGTFSSIMYSTFTHDNAVNGAGILLNVGAYIYKCSLFNETATEDGGGIYLRSSNTNINPLILNALLTANKVGVISTNITNCSAGHDGGAGYVYGDFGVVSDTRMINCSAGHDGGAGYVKGNNGTLRDSLMINNKAQNNGGALVWVGNGGNANNITCNYNEAITGAGGAIYLENSSNSQFNKSTFKYNIAGRNGGAIDWFEGATGGSVQHTVFINNTAKRSGGAVYWNGDAGAIIYCGFYNNSASGVVRDADGTGGDGGAIIWTGHNGYVSRSNFVNNSADRRGGAVYLKDNDNTYFILDYFENNTAGTNGGAIDWLEGATNGHLLNSVFVGNVAKRSGGAVFWNGENGTLSNVSFSYNRALGQVSAVNIFGVETTGGDGGAIIWTGNFGNVSNCNFTFNSADKRGGAVFLQENVNGTFDKCWFVNNTAGTNGGAIDWFEGAVNGSITNSQFINNTAGRSGGAVYWNGDTGAIIYCGFYNNSASGVVRDADGTGGDGGAIIWTGHNGYVSRSNFVNNSADRRGGAVYLNDNDNTYFILDYFENNTAGTNGGAIDWHEGAENGHVLNSVFEQNTAKRSGGAIYWNGNNGEIKNSNFTNNKAEGIASATDAFGNITYGGDGGAVIWIGSHGTVDNCRFVDNEAAKRGGAVYLQGTSKANATDTSFTNSYFERNVAGTNGGAIDWNKGAHDGLIDNAQFVDNVAKRSGGAVYWNGNNGEIKNSNFTNNKAEGINNSTDAFGVVTYGGDGGAVIWIGPHGLVDNCRFIDNEAAKRGGAVYLQGTSEANCTDTNFTNSYFERNVAGTNGGAIDWNEGAHDGLVDNSVFINNVAKMFGGAIYWNGNNGEIKNSNFTNNNATNGGAIYFALGSSNSQIINSRFINSYVSEDGGAVYVIGDDCQIHNTSFINNEAYDDGGAIYWVGDNGIIFNITCLNNIANTTVRISNNVYKSSKGGAVCFTGSNALISNSTFTLGLAAVEGGSLFITGNYVNVTNCIFDRNKVRYDDNDKYDGDPIGGGSLYIIGNYTKIENNTVIRSNARFGGVIYIQGDYAEVIGLKSLYTYATQDGGAIYVLGNNATIKNSQISFSNATSRNGGAIFIAGSNTIIEGSTFDHNFASVSGGVIYIKGIHTIINNSNFNNSISNKEGGAVYLLAESSNDQIIHSNFTNNKALNSGGGAIYWGAGAYNGYIIDSIFDNNYGNGHGGAVYWGRSSYGYVINSTFKNNLAEGNGGALYWNGEYGSLINTTFTCNYANSIYGHANYAGGGAIEWSAKYGLFDNCTFENNTCKLSGGHAGAVYGHSSSFLTVNNSRFIGNYANQGGVFYMESAEHISFLNSNFTNNSAKSNGGAIYFNPSGSGGSGCTYADMFNCIFEGNNAAEASAINWNVNHGIINSTTFKNNYISNCIKDNHGVVMIFGGDNNTIVNSVFDNNFVSPSVSVHELFGIVYFSASASKIISSNFTNNQLTGGQGGAVFVTKGGAVLDNLLCVNNSADAGGAIIFHNKAWIPDNSIIANSTFVNNSANYGGAINWVSGDNGKLYNSVFINNTASEGGAVRWTVGYGQMYDCNFTNNSAIKQTRDLKAGIIHWSGAYGNINNILINGSYSATYAGAISWFGNYGNLGNVTIMDSTAGSNGGSIYVNANHVSINDTEIINSIAKSSNGGAIYLDSNAHNATLYNVSIINSTSNNGGAIYSIAPNGNLVNLICINSTANNGGGGIYWSSNNQNLVVNFTLSNALFVNNTAKEGGAIYLSRVGGSISGSSFESNNASNNGGAIYTLKATPVASLTITGSSFNLNSAGAYAGAIYSGYEGQIIQYCNFTNNLAKYGGAIVVANSNQVITNSLFKGNNASDYGGSIYLLSGISQTTVENSTFKNSYAYNGGAIYNSGDAGASLYVKNDTFISNIASHNGGAIYYIVGGTTSSPVIYRDYLNFDNRGIIDSETGRTTVTMARSNDQYADRIYESLFENNMDYLLNVTSVADPSNEIATVYISNPRDSDKNSVKIVINLTDSTGDLLNQLIIDKNNYDTYHSSLTGIFTVTFRNLTYGKSYKVIIGYSDKNYIYKENTTNFTVEGKGMKGDFHILQGLIDDAVRNGKHELNLTRSYYFTFEDNLDDSCMNITSDNFTINGNGFIISALGYSRIFNITANNVTLNNIVFSDGNAGGKWSDDVDKGGAIFWAGANGTVKNSIFMNNSAEYGGGIYYNSTAGNCAINNTQFISNNADCNGGAIDCNASKMGLYNSVFESNYADYGAALCREKEATGGHGDNNTFISNNAKTAGAALAWISAESININHYTFIDNTAGYSGGAIYVGVGSGNCIVNNSYFEGNNVTNLNDGHGGAIEWYAQKGSVLNSTFINNNAYSGGAIYASTDSSQISINQSKFISNNAYNNGGAISLDASNVNVIGSEFYNNTAKVNGGAIYLGGGAEYTLINNSKFTNNSAKVNGGAIDCNSTNMNLLNTLFESNYAQFGSALCREENVKGGSGVNNTFISNHAYVSGAALAWMGGAGIKITNYTFINNTADVSGGAIYISPTSSNCTIITSKFENNYVTNATKDSNIVYWTAFDGTLMSYNCEDGNITSGAGGAINSLAANITVLSSNFTNNSARLGGAVFVGTENGTTNINNSRFILNNAYERGGAVNINASAVSVNNTQFIANTATDGGAMYVSGKGVTNYVLNSEFIENTALGGHGGAIEWVSSEGHIEFSNFTRNSADYGGAIYFNGQSHNSSVVNVRFVENNATYNGGAIDWDAQEGKLYNTTFISNYAGEYGAAVCRESGATKGSGKNNTFISNHAGIAGAALAWMGVSGVNINDYHFIDNYADVEGGAIYVADGGDNCTVNMSYFTGNYVNNDTTGRGGAISIVADNATIINSNFTQNRAFNGGAVYVAGESGRTNIKNVTFIRNEAYNDGGAINLIASSVTMNDTRYYSNTAQGSGGAVYVGGVGTDNKIYNSTFKDNHAQDSGGAIDWKASAGEILYSNFTSNTAEYGGAIYLNGISSNSKIANAIFTSNEATKNGGAIDCNAASMDLENTQFISNYAGEYGAALCREENATRGYGGNNTFIKNHADIAGAALAWLGVDGVTIRNYTFINNTADLSGGAIYVRGDSDGCNVINSTFDNNYVTDHENGRGGTIDWLGSNGYVYNSTFSNSFAVTGGTIYAGENSDNLTIDQSRFISSLALGEGGSIYLCSDNATINNTNFTYSLSLKRGGAIAAYNIDNIAVNNVIVTHTVGAGYVDSSMKAYGEGGAFYIENSTNLKISHSAFNDLQSHSNGGSISAVNCNDSVLYNLTFTKQFSVKNGGAISWINSTNVTIDKSNFTDSSAYYYGGAIYLENMNNTFIKHSIFNETYTSRGDGGAIYVTGNVTIDNSTFDNYQVLNNYGGAIHLDNGTSTISNSSFNGPDAIWVAANANSTIVKNNITGQYPNRQMHYLSPQDLLDERNKYYSIWNNGIISLNGNKFDYIIFNNGTIESRTYMDVLDNKTWNATWNEDFVFWANITDDNDNTIISVRTLDTSNDQYPDAKYIMPYNYINLKTIYQGKFVISGEDSGLKDNVMRTGTLYVKMPTSMGLAVEKTNEGEKVTITAKVYNYGNYTYFGNVVFKIGNKTYSAIINNIAGEQYGIATLQLNNTPSGTYTVYASYPGDDLHWDVDNSTFFTINLRNPSIKIQVADIYYGQTEVINVTINATGHILIYINGKSQFVPIVNGTAQFNISKLNPGNQSVVAVYTGNSYYSAIGRDASFTVYKLNTTIKSEPTTPTELGKAQIIKVTVDKNATGYVEITVGDEVYAQKIKDGVATFRIYDLEKGVYTDIPVKYVGDDYYNANATTTSFTIGLTNDYDIAVITENISYGQNETIYVILPASVNDNVTIYINDTKYENVSVINGIAKLIVPNLNAGDYVINVTFAGDDTYLAKDKNGTTFEVSPSSSYCINVTAADVKVGENTTITVNVPKDATGSVTIWVNGTKLVNNTIVDGVATFTLNKTISGKYNVNATLTDVNYANKTAYDEYYVSKYGTPIDIDVDSIYVGDKAIVTVTVLSDVINNVTIEIDGKKYNKTVDENGRAVFEVTNLTEGNKTVTATYGGDRKYLFNSTTANFTVSKRASTIVVTATNTTVGNYTVISVEIPSNATGFVIVNINGTEYSINTTDGRGSVKVYNLGNGTYRINATYIGDNQYLSNTNYTSFKVDKLNTTISIGVESITYGNSTNVIVTVDANVTGTIHIKLNENDLGNFTIADGKVTVPLSGLAADNYTVYATYNGNDKYNVNDTNKGFEVRKATPTIQIIYSDVEVDGCTTVTFIINATTTGNLTGTVAGKSFNERIVDGTVTVTSDKLANQTYTITVDYEGDKNYTDAHNSTTFTVSKVSDYELNVIAGDIHVGGLTDITVNVPSDAEGIVIVEINGINYTATIHGGKAVFENSTGLGEGKYNITVYFGNEKYSNKTVKAEFYIFKVQTPIEINVTSSYAADKVIINVTVPSDVANNVTIEIDGKKYNKTVDENGRVVFEITNLVAGDKTVTAIYSGDDKYLFNSTTSNFTVSQYGSFVKVNTTEIHVGDDAVINVTVPQNATGKVIVSINGTEYSVNITNGNGTLTVKGLGNGTYNINVTYIGDGQYLSNKNSTTLTVSKLQTSITVRGSDISVGESELLIIESPDNITSPVKVEINGKNQTAFIINGKGNITLYGLAADDYDVKVYFEGNYKYLNATGEGGFKVKQTSVDIQIIPQNITYGEKETITIYIDATGTVNITVDGIDYNNRDIVDGKVVFEVPGYLTASNYTVNVTYNANKNYTVSSAKVNFTVAKADPVITIEVQNITYGDTEHIIVKVNAEGNVTITAANNSTTIKLGEEATWILRASVDAIVPYNGQATLNIKNLPAGVYPVTATYNGNANYNAKTVDTFFVVEKQNITVFVEVNNISVNNNEVINISLSNTNATGNVVINVNGENHTKGLIGGLANLTLSNLANGSHSVFVIYDGDLNFNGNWTQVTFNVSKLTSNVVVDADDTRVGAIEKIVISLPDDATGFVVIDVDGVKYHVDIVAGEEIYLEIDNLVNKNYNVTVTYSGDDKYESSSNKTSFNVIKSDTEMEVTDLGNGTVVVTLPNNATGNVTIRVGNENYTAELEHGRAVIDLDKTPSGVYEANVEYTGDGEYDPQADSVVVNIPVHDTPIDINVNDVLVGDAATVTVTVPDKATGKITIEIDGVKYESSIENGKAVFKVSGLDEGKKTVAVNYDGDKNFTRNFTTAQFTVSKRSSTISAKSINIKVGHDEVITVTVPKDATGRVLVDIDGVGYYANIINGVAKIVAPELFAGTYKATVTYEGDDKYLPSKTTTSFKVTKTTSIIKATGDDVTQGNDATVVVSVPKDATGSVTITVGDKKYTADVKNGKVVFIVPGLSKGDYKVDAKYSGNKYYESNDTITDIDVHYGGSHGHGHNHDEHHVSAGNDLTTHATGNPIFALLFVLLAIGSAQLRRLRK